MSHEMETGQRKDAQGAVIPAWFIQNVTVALTPARPCWPRNGARRCRRIRFSSFKFKGGAKGEKVTITWVDNRGDKRTDEATIA